MNIWHDISPKAITKNKFTAVIEIPKGSKVKYELDKATGLLRMDRIMRDRRGDRTHRGRQDPLHLHRIPLELRTHPQDHRPRRRPSRCVGHLLGKARFNVTRGVLPDRRYKDARQRR